MNANEAGTVSKEHIDEMAKYRDGLKPIEIGESGQIKEWYDETEFGQTANGAIPSFDAKHRHIAHLLGVYPGDLVTVDNNTVYGCGKSFSDSAWR